MKPAKEMAEGTKQLAIRLATTYAALKAAETGPAEKLVIGSEYKVTDAQIKAIASEYARTVLKLADAETLKKWLTEPVYNELKQKDGKGRTIFNTDDKAVAKYFLKWGYPEELQCEPLAVTANITDETCKCWIMDTITAKTAIKKGRLQFELRRTNPLYEALAQQFKEDTLPEVLKTASFEEALALVKKHKALVERTKRLVDFINTPLAAKKADSLQALIRLNNTTPYADLAQKLATEYNNLAATQTSEVGEWLLRMLWISKGKKLTATPTEVMKADSLLYKGVLLVSDSVGIHGKGLVKMRNHDAAQAYKLTNTQPASSINEVQDMAVLVHNLLEANKPSIGTVSITPIDKDVDLLGIAMTREKGGKRPAKKLTEREKEKLKLLQEATDFVDNYNTLAVSVAPFAQWQWWMRSQGKPDTTPSYRTEELAYQHPSPSDAPALIKYELKDGGSAITGIAGYTYRYNKLYRFRFKAGLLYSSLLRSTYTIDPVTNTAVRVDKREGQNAAFGLQIFPARIDIKQPGRFPKGNGFVYLGFILNDKLAKNWLVGGGAEITSGLALMAGVHLSQTQRLRVTNGRLNTTEDLWRPGVFAQLAIGLEAFNALFGGPAIKNPF